jgi:hypothetical protein
MTRVIPCFLHIPMDDKPWDNNTTAQKLISQNIPGATLAFDHDKFDRFIDEPDTCCHSTTEFDSLPECAE